MPIPVRKFKNHQYYVFCVLKWFKFLLLKFNVLMWVVVYVVLPVWKKCPVTGDTSRMRERTPETSGISRVGEGRRKSFLIQGTSHVHNSTNSIWARSSDALCRHIDDAG